MVRMLAMKTPTATANHQIHKDGESHDAVHNTRRLPGNVVDSLQEAPVNDVDTAPSAQCPPAPPGGMREVRGGCPQHYHPAKSGRG